jgi:NAD(P)H-hydrate epimerase
MRRIAPFVFLCGRSLLHESINGCAWALSRNTLFSRTTTNLLPRSAIATTVALFSAASSSGDSPKSSSASSSSCNQAAAMTTTGTGYLNAVDAAALDVELMSTPGFSLEQLMELAGLAVAEAVYQAVPPVSTTRKVLLVCGPGNNGGDGLVAARHLYFFGNYDCTVVYPKRSTKQHFVNLVKQCEDVGISMVEQMPPKDEIDSYDAIVDAIFGFSFKGAPREPFGTILHQLKEAQEADNNQIIISVDVPSGWNVDEGDMANTGFVPDVLISLTAPKLCTKEFGGRHFIGGRFLPPKVASKYSVRMPPYEGVSQVMEVTCEHIEGESPKAAATTANESSSSPSNDSWKDEYAAYLAKKEQEQAAQRKADTTTTASPTALSKETDTDEATNDDDSSSGEEDTWEAQYYAYCAEKEARLAKEDAKQKEALRKQ